MVKYVVVTGGSVSGLGKGTLVSSCGVVLRSCGYRVTSIKIDPYLNVDAGTISPSEHGEVFVLADGHEGDLDLGNYERAFDVCLTRDHNVTTGKIYRKIIQAERNGDYLGATVQMIPHVTDAIQEWITRVSHICVDTHQSFNSASPPDCPPDICLVEVGGTVGDIESSVYLEALQQFFSRLSSTNDCCLCHLVYIPTIGAEQKTKCAQHSFKALREAGLAADFILGRAEAMLEPGAKRKISIFGGVKEEQVFGLPDVKSSYYLPQLLIDQNFHKLLTSRLGLPLKNLSQQTIFHGLTPVDAWKRMGQRLEQLKSLPVVKIAFVAKYIGSNDTYLSVLRAMEHSSTETLINAELVWIKAEDLEPPAKTTDGNPPPHQNAAWDLLRSCQGVLVPGGFGQRGTEGMILAIRYARENNIPFLGICLGMQLACVEGARSFLQMPKAGSEEFGAEASDRVIIYMPETINQVMGGTMRLGNRQTLLKENSLASRIYDGETIIIERHRHRYEFNGSEFFERLAQHDYDFSGKDLETGERLEVIELKNHPYFLGVQFHPELTSKPVTPNPCFLSFVLASAGKLHARFKHFDGKLKPGSAFLMDDHDTHQWQS